MVPITAISLQRFNRNDSMKFYHFRFIFFANIFHKLSEDFMSKDMNCSFIYRLSFFFQHRPSILQAFFPSHFGKGKMEWISREREGATHFIANNYILFIFSLFFSFFVHHSSSKTVLQRQFQKWPFRNGTLFYSCIKICGEKNCWSISTYVLLIHKRNKRGTNRKSGTVTTSFHQLSSQFNSMHNICELWKLIPNLFECSHTQVTSATANKSRIERERERKTSKCVYSN